MGSFEDPTRTAALEHGKHGHCIIRREGDTITVTDADPTVLISAELVDEFTAGNRAPEVTLDGDVLTINAANRRVVYVIDRRSYDAHTRCYVMRWPD